MLLLLVVSCLDVSGCTNFFFGRAKNKWKAPIVKQEGKTTIEINNDKKKRLSFFFLTYRKRKKNPFLQNKNSENAKKVVIIQISKDEHDRHQYYITSQV